MVLPGLGDCGQVLVNVRLFNWILYVCVYTGYPSAVALTIAIVQTALPITSCRLRRLLCSSLMFKHSVLLTKPKLLQPAPDHTEGLGLWAKG